MRRRNPKSYEGITSPLHPISDLLHDALNDIGKKYQDRADLILTAWWDLIPAQLRNKTEPLSFKEGVLTVRVKDSTLYSLLSQYEKARLTHALQRKFPHVPIRTILFRMS
jgi:hypothetical protein